MPLSNYKTLINEKDHYKVLGVNKDASPEAIKNAYRKRALAVHPDRLPPAEQEQGKEVFQRLGTAYEILSDAAKRKAYDENPNDNQSSTTNENSYEAFWQEALNLSKESTRFTVGAETTNEILLNVKMLVQSIVDKPKTKWIAGYRYQAVSNVAAELLNEIILLENDLKTKIKPQTGNGEDLPCYTKADVHAFLFGVLTAVRDAQNKNEFNVHRGFIHTLPILHDITIMLQVLIRFIGLCLYKLYDRNTTVYKNGLRQGLFAPPKTTTQQKIDALNNHLDRDLDSTKPYKPYRDQNISMVVTASHDEFSRSRTLRTWAQF